MSLGILGHRALGASSAPIPRIDLGPECAPGFPCSEAAEQRQIMERGLTAFLNRSRNPPGVLSPQNDPLLQQYQDAYQQLSPEYASVLSEQASTIAEMRQRSLDRRTPLRGPYYVIPAPGPFLTDAARAGTRYEPW